MIKYLHHVTNINNVYSIITGGFVGRPVNYKIDEYDTKFTGITPNNYIWFDYIANDYNML